MPINVSVGKVRRGPALTLDFSITVTKEKCEISKGPFSIVDTAIVYFRFEHFVKESNSDFLRMVILRKKHPLVIDSIVELNVSYACEAFEYSRQLTCPVDLTYGEEISTEKIDISKPYSLQINMYVIKKEKITFAKLYEDTDLTDFHLSTEGGSVAVHRACLAMHSDMFYTMLLGKWKETKESSVELEGVSLQTLQHLKQYIYLGTLPEDVRQLLLFAKCYLLDNLKQDCLMNLARSVSPENLYELQEFACENNVIELSRFLMQVTTSKAVHGAYKIEMAAKTSLTDDDNTENDAQNEK